MPYFDGLLEGFNGARDARIAQTQQQDAQRRQQEGDLYKYLLQSTDPQIQSLALSGLFESARPGTKAKGLKGFMGEVQGGEIYPQIQSVMNQLVPEQGQVAAAPNSSPVPPAKPGSGALPGTSLVDPGGGGLPGRMLPPETPPGNPMGGTGGAAEAAPAAAPTAEMTPPPANPLAAGVGSQPPPQQSRFKRRGTGVPTAEEIAESSSRAQMRGRIAEITAQLQAAGATPEEIQDAVLGIAGAPRSQRTLSAISQWGVKLTPDGPTQPVLLDQGKGFVLPGGQPMPAHAIMVRMTGSTGTGGVPRKVKEPDLNSSTGWSTVFLDTATGAELYRHDDTPFVPPPAFGGTTEIVDPGSSTGSSRVRLGRDGGQVRIGDAPATGVSQDQADAVGYKAEVDRRIKELEAPGFAGGPKKKVLPAQLEKVIQEVTHGTYRTYADVVAAGQRTAPNRPGGTTAPASLRDPVLEILEGRPPRP